MRKGKGNKAVLFLSCRKCMYEKRAVGPAKVAPRMNCFDREGVVVLGEKEHELRTLPTAKVECHRCGENLAYTWQVQLKSLEESSTQFFRCTKCNYTFRENS